MKNLNDPFGFEKAINWDVVDNLTLDQLTELNAMFDKDKQALKDLSKEEE